MIIPAAMDIYSAQDSLRNRAKLEIDDELKELRVSNARGSFEDGYLLGLETIRVCNAGMVKAVLALAKDGLRTDKDLA